MVVKMEINNWIVKDITFHEDDRKKVFNHVSRLIKSGWDLNEGEAIDGAMFGEVQEMFGENNELIPTEFEVVQLIKTK